jgi:hypothetical protein
MADQKLSLIPAIEEQPALAAAEDAQKAIGKAFEVGGAPGQKLKNFLHGTWLGHPMHPVLADVPLGAWTVALIFGCAERGSRFDLHDGKVLDGPATFPQPRFETRVREGQIEVRATNGTH